METNEAQEMNFFPASRVRQLLAVSLGVSDCSERPLDFHLHEMTE